MAQPEQPSGGGLRRLSLGSQRSGFQQHTAMRYATHENVHLGEYNISHFNCPSPPAGGGTCNPFFINRSMRRPSTLSQVSGSEESSLPGHDAFPSQARVPAYPSARLTGEHGSPASSSASATFSPTHAQFTHNKSGSQIHLLKSNPAVDDTRTRSSPIDMPPRYKRWCQLSSSYSMCLFFLCGLAFAIGHDRFYAHLNGQKTEFDKQLVVWRYGTVLAYASKASFIACMVTAFRQCVWATTHDKVLSLAALDSLFAATDDIRALMNLEIYWKASFAMALAVIFWLTPLVVVFTSSTLGVQSNQLIDETLCHGVRTLSFSQEATSDWRHIEKNFGLLPMSMSLWNTTTGRVSPQPDYSFDYYTAAGENLDKVATWALYSKGAVSDDLAPDRICLPLKNCSFEFSFIGPGYKCAEVAVDGQGRASLGEHMAPFGIDVLLPNGNYSYYAHATQGDYPDIVMANITTGGVIPDPSNAPPNLGTFRVEPIIWVGYAERTNLAVAPPLNRTMPGWQEAFRPKMFACEHYNMSYVARTTFQRKIQSIVVLNRTALNPVIDTVYVPGDANDGTEDKTKAVPESNYVHPRPAEKYREIAAYHSLGKQLRDFVNGTVQMVDYGHPIPATKAQGTKLINSEQDYFAYPDAMDRIQGMYEDIIFSVLTDRQFVAVVFEGDRELRALQRRTTDVLPESPCKRWSQETQFHYAQRQLWIVYGIFLAFTFIAMIRGMMAVTKNGGVVRDLRYSSLVAATRHTEA